MIEFPEYRDPRTLLSSINMIAEEEFFSVLDAEVAASALRSASATASKLERDWIMIAVAACHRKTRSGHSHLDLIQPEPDLMKHLECWPDQEFWIDAFSKFDSSDTRLPILWEPPRYLYLRKLWNFETGLSTALASRATIVAPTRPGSETDIPATLFEGCSGDQQQAIRAVVEKSLILLSGGPGTGKTFTVLRCLAALLSQQPEARIALLAPTGKAVARLNASISQGLEHLQVSETIKARIPVSARTIHRFLNEIDTHRGGNFIPYPPAVFDWVFIDEVSMVDLRLMKRLLDAIPDPCRLFMLGDVHQLASVEPGSVFSDLYQTVDQDLPATTGFQTIELEENFRFSIDSPIHRLCEAVKAGNWQMVNALLDDPASQMSIDCCAPEQPDTNRILDCWIADRLIEPLLTPEPETALRQFRESMLLCATNRGRVGVETLNARIRQRLEGVCHSRGLSAYWSPVLITQNDYRNDLFNGDIGLQRLSLRDAEDAGQVVFERNNSLYRISRTQLPAHTDAFALTVHKSQGSEADHVMILLPEADSPVLTRELLYTALSRAKTRLSLIASPESIGRAVQQRTERNSRLGQKLHARLAS